MIQETAWGSQRWNVNHRLLEIKTSPWEHQHSSVCKEYTLTPYYHFIPYTSLESQHTSCDVCVCVILCLFVYACTCCLLACVYVCVCVSECVRVRACVCVTSRSYCLKKDHNMARSHSLDIWTSNQCKLLFFPWKGPQNDSSSPDWAVSAQYFSGTEKPGLPALMACVRTSKSPLSPPQDLVSVRDCECSIGFHWED